MQNQRENPTPTNRMTGPPAEPESPLRSWFMEPPYPGVWIAGALVAVVAALVTSAVTTRRPAPEVQIVARPPITTPGAPSPSVTVREQPAPPPEAEIPKVHVRSAPPEKNAPPANQPAESVPSTGAANAPGEPALNAPAPIGEGEPLPLPRGDEVPAPGAAPRGIEPPVITRPVEPPAPEPVPEPAPRQPARPRAPEAVAPERTAGRMAIFFDADSSTFDRRGRRLPLRVEVYVDGRKVLESDDPEKQEFNVGRLRDGWHDVEIIPFVADAPSDPRRQRVYIEAGSESRFKAVLRREDGTSRISKFKERD